MPDKLPRRLRRNQKKMSRQESATSPQFAEKLRAKTLSLKTPGQVTKELGERIRQLRLRRNWTRKTLAARAGVSQSSLKRFESSGQASLNLVLQLAQALDRLEDFDSLFGPSKARNLAELEKAQAPSRQRGRK